jgi:hypothetical protein
MLNSPDCEASQDTTSQKHANVLSGSLDDGPDCNDYAHHLHEANSTKLVADGSLHQSPESLAGNIGGDDLPVCQISSPAPSTLDSLAYSAGQALVRLVHVVDPALVRDSCEGDVSIYWGLFLLGDINSLVVAMPVSKPY